MSVLRRFDEPVAKIAPDEIVEALGNGNELILVISSLPRRHDCFVQARE